MLAFLGAQVAQLDEQIAELERQMKQTAEVLKPGEPNSN